MWTSYFFFIRQGISNDFTSRFLGFSLYISNTTNKSDGILCFKDTSFTRSTIPAVFSTNCFVHGQYVIYYNERTENATYPNEYSTYAYNELCEVEVFGKNYLFSWFMTSIRCEFQISSAFYDWINYRWKYRLIFANQEM